MPRAGVLVLLVSLSAAPSVRAQERVVQARAARGAAVVELFRAAKVPYPAQEVFLRAFKTERVLELWARGQEPTFTLVKTYPVCATSGTLGPKRRMGDLQVPEGFYRVDRFNPMSNFHLSLGVSYPNASDRVLGVRGRLGGDIFIHGDCVTVGCIPIQDGPIEEVYLAALDARAQSGRPVTVHIFPRRMDAAGMAQLQKDAAGDTGLWDFWKGLEPGYRAFEQTHRLPRVTVDAKGRYRVAP